MRIPVRIPRWLVVVVLVTVFQENVLGQEAFKVKPWPNATVPYRITGKFSKQHLREIYEAMHEFEKHTCIRFKQYFGEEHDYAVIGNEYPNCFSDIGLLNARGEQYVNLVPPCTLSGEIMHELMHLLGFGHEHNRIDRDDYLTINWQNIRDGRIRTFEKNVDTFNVTYDYSSITHYLVGTYTKNGLPTMTPKKPARKIGQRLRLSEGDIKKIKSLYKCT